MFTKRIRPLIIYCRSAAYADVHAIFPAQPCNQPLAPISSIRQPPRLYGQQTQAPKSTHVVAQAGLRLSYRSQPHPSFW